jgi:hypothetical protein
MKQQLDQKAIPEIGSLILKQAYFAWFKICLHRSSLDVGGSSVFRQDILPSPPLRFPSSRAIILANSRNAAEGV